MQRKFIPDYYAALKIPNTATQEEIKRAYRELVLRCHPDKGGSKEFFIPIQEAYETLSNVQKRSLYDRTCAGDDKAYPEFKASREEMVRAIIKRFANLFQGQVSHFEDDIDSAECFTPKTLERGMYFVVGTPMQLSSLVTPKRRLNTLFANLQPRHELIADFKTSELLRTFPQAGEVKVFLDERTANLYVHCSRKGLPHQQGPFIQSCVFGVESDVKFTHDQLRYGRIVVVEEFSKSRAAVPYLVTAVSNLKPVTVNLELPHTDENYLPGGRPDYGKRLIAQPDGSISLNKDVLADFVNGALRRP